MHILIKHLPVRKKQPYHFSPSAVVENEKPVEKFNYQVNAEKNYLKNITEYFRILPCYFHL